MQRFSPFCRQPFKLTMKLIKTLAGLLAVMLCIAGCKKSSSEGSSTSIVGSWELRQSYGQVGRINYPAGNNYTIKFTASTYSTSDTTQSFMIRGNHRTTGTYTIIEDNSAGNSTGILISKGQFTSRLILDDDTSSEKIFIQVANNKLEFLSGYFPLDGGVQLTYQKN
jgi:hypothetical protein